MTTATSWIIKKADPCGGDACIRHTRITVWGLVEWRLLGQSDEQIIEGIQRLTQADLEAAWDYYASHREGIDEAIGLNVDVAVLEMTEMTPEPHPLAKFAGMF